MAREYSDKEIETLSAYFWRRKEMYKELDMLGRFGDQDDLLTCLRFDDHRLLLPSGTLGNYFVDTRGRRYLNSPANNSAASRGAMELVPSIWPGLPAIRVSKAVTNLLLQPSVEILQTQWIVNFNIAVNRSLIQSSTGAYGLQAVPSNAVNYTGHDYVAFPGSTAVTWAVWVYSPTAGGTVVISLWQYNAVPAFLGSFNPVTYTLVEGWQRLVYTDTTVAGCTQVRCMLQNFPNPGTYYVDGAGLYADNHDVNHVDGQLGDGFSWSGTPHNTSSARVANSISGDADARMFDSESALTVTAWVQAYADYNGTWDTDFPRIFDLYKDANNYLRLFYQPSTQRWWFQITIAGVAVNNFGANNVAFEKYDWLHVAVSWDYAGYHKIYLNGQLLATTDMSALAPITAWANFRIGTDWLGTNVWGGAFAEFCAWKRVLNEREILNLWAKRDPVVDQLALEKNLNVGCVVYRNADQALTGPGVWTTVLINSTEYNEHMIVDYGSALVRVTEPGWYQLSGRISFTPPGAGAWYAVGIMLNGVTYVAIDSREQGAANVLNPTNATSRLYYLVPGDYVRLEGITSTGGTMLALASYSLYLEVVKIRNVFAEGA